MVGILLLNCCRMSNSFFQNNAHWVLICFISCTVTHAISKNHTKLIDFLVAILRIAKVMVTYFMQNNFLWMCICRQWLWRSFMLKGLGRPSQGGIQCNPASRDWRVILWVLWLDCCVRNLDGTLTYSVGPECLELISSV